MRRERKVRHYGPAFPGHILQHFIRVPADRWKDPRRHAWTDPVFGIWAIIYNVRILRRLTGTDKAIGLGTSENDDPITDDVRAAWEQEKRDYERRQSGGKPLMD